MMRVAQLHILQHVDFEGPGGIALWASMRRIPITIHALHRGDPVPNPQPDHGLCIMGGPMNIYDDELYPWLPQERAFLENLATTHDPLPVLGICLGAQLLAHALGAKIYRNHTQEIGWMPVEWLNSWEHTFGDAQTQVLHWHGDTFDLPQGAEQLARSAHCEHQAFQHGKILGLQFHLEAGLAECQAMTFGCGDDLSSPTPTIHPMAQILHDAAHAECSAILNQILDNHFQIE
ncbi:MAG: type 1 glutamine amidotransferase [Verrucomicrobiales bacterium]